MTRNKVRPLREVACLISGSLSLQTDLADTGHALALFREHDAVPAIFFRLIERLVGLPHQFGWRFPQLGIERDPDGKGYRSYLAPFMAQAETRH